MSSVSPVAKLSPEFQNSLKQFTGKGLVTQSSPTYLSCMETKSDWTGQERQSQFLTRIKMVLGQADTSTGISKYVGIS